MSDVLSGMVAALAASTWLAMTAAMTAFLALFGGLQVCARKTSARPETTRKLLHIGSGLLTLPFPFLFREAWPVLALTGVSALVIAAGRCFPAVRARPGGVPGCVARTTFGEFYFPLAVALLFVLTRGGDPLLFVIPVLVLTLADAAAALVGARYGQTRYWRSRKSLEGSVAFSVVAFLCVHVPMLGWSTAGRIDSFLIAATCALLVMLLEGTVWRGLDNLVVPLAGYVLLQDSLGLGTIALLARLAVTVGLVLVVFLLHVRASAPARASGRGASSSLPVHLHVRT